MGKLSKLKVAIVHDWVVVKKGAEKCLESFCEIFPNSEVYTLLYKKGVSTIVDGRKIHHSFLQRFPGWKGYYRYLYPLMPIAIESFNFDKYDLVISSSHSVAKGIITSPHTCHISYIHSPMRYAWDMYEDYFGKESGMSLFKRMLILPQVHLLRLWDQSSASRPDYLIANSKLVSQRILKHWNRKSEVVNPPVDVTRFKIGERKKEYFLMVTSFEPNKKVDLAVKAFTELGYPLKIVGSTGRLMNKIKKMSGLNVEFLGRVSDDEIVRLYSEAKAFVLPGKDDFGISPLEAIASGTPVIAYGKGGSLETVVPINPESEDCIRFGAKNGVFFYEQEVTSLKKAIRSFLEYNLNQGWDQVRMRKWTKRFTTSNYKMMIKRLITKKYEEFQNQFESIEK